MRRGEKNTKLQEISISSLAVGRIFFEALGISTLHGYNRAFIERPVFTITEEH
jgi:hypothetical protein